MFKDSKNVKIAQAEKDIDVQALIAYNMAASITVHLQIFKCPQLPCFSTVLDQTGIKIHGLLRSFKLIMVLIRVTVPFKL